MTDLERKIETLQQQIERLAERLSHFESGQKVSKTPVYSPEQIKYFDSLPADSTVGKDYVAWRFCCSEYAVMRGKAGTGKIRRVGQKPIKFIKKEVDEAWREKSKTPAEKAAEVRAKAHEKKNKRRRSIITKPI